MRNHWFMPFLFLCGSALLALVGCGPRATGGATATLADSGNSVIDMPALVVDINQDGVPSIDGLSLTDFASLTDLDQATVDSLTLDPAIVAYLTGSNIQHIQIDNTPDGILILVNGQPIPFFAWDEESLVTAAQVAEGLGADINLLDKLLPLVRTVGVGVIVRFPIAADTAALPAVAPPEESAAAASRQAQRQFLDAIGTAPKVQLTVDYDSTGAWTVGELSQEEWSTIAPIPWEMLNLPPNVVREMEEAGIESIELATGADGIFLSVNGEPLPYLAWDRGELRHVLELVRQLKRPDGALGDMADLDNLINMLEQLLPVVQMTEVNLVINFP